MSNEEYPHEQRATPRSGRQAAQQVGRLMTEQKNRAADGLHRLAGVVRDRTHRLGQTGVRGQMATSADRVAARMDSMSTYVREADVSTLLRDAGRLARRRPEVLVAGGFVAGLVLGRYLGAPRRGGAGLWRSAPWHEALQRGTQVLSAAADTVKEGLEARGLSGSRLARRVAIAGDRYWRES